MNIVKFGYRPTFSSLFDEVFERAFGEDSEVACKPAANIRETEKSYLAELILPGFEKEEITVNMEKNVLNVIANHEEKESKEEGKYTWSEFRKINNYKRSFVLPEDVNADGIKAEYRNGILTVTLPKMEPVTEPVKQITIG